jgi:hypothetical protein
VKEKKTIKFIMGFVLSGFIAACGTFGNTTGTEAEAEVMITRIDPLKGTASVYIDGKKYNMQAGDTKVVKLPNGNHNLEVSYTKFISEQVIFTSNSDRNNVKVEVLRDNSKSRQQMYSIVLHVEEITPRAITGSNLEAAVHRAYYEIVKEIPEKSRVALINISAADEREGEFVLNELTDLLVNSKRHSVVDRKSLDSIREERNFQLTGEVDDNSAVNIGKMLDTVRKG